MSKVDKHIIIEGQILKHYDESIIPENGIVELDSSIIELGEEVFARSERLYEIILHEGIKKIGWAAFARCESLRKITLPYSLEEIDDYAFLSCTALQSIELPRNIKIIGNAALNGIKCPIKINGINPYFTTEKGLLYNKDKTKLLCCPNIHEDFSLEGNINEVAWSAFRACSKLKKLKINEGVNTLGEDACYDCTNLEEIILSDSLEDIGWLAFSRCKSLRRIKLPKRIKSLGWALFSDCRALKEIILPEHLESIGLAVFAHCHSLEKLTLPHSLKEIEGGAFSDCPQLKTITCLSEKPPLVEDFDFRGTILVPKGTKEQYSKAKGWKLCSSIYEIPHTTLQG